MDRAESTFKLRPSDVLEATGPDATFVVTIKGIIVCAERILLLRKSGGRWDLPGGKLEAGESVAVGLRREIAEETGLRVDVDRIVDSWLRTRNIKPSKFVVTYVCRPLPVQPVVRISDEHVEYGFFSPAVISDLPMLDGTRGSLNAVFERWSDPGPWLPGLR